MRDPRMVVAGVVVTLAFLLFAAFVVWALRTNHRTAAAIMATASLLAALPAILYALLGGQP